jgi:hypothetical protein
MKKAAFPNTFIIGAQKAGSTTLNNWLSQHPQVYAYNSLKDIPLFYYFKTEEQLQQRLLLEKPAYQNQPVVLHSAVNYILYPQLLQAIAQKAPKAKLIFIIRHPVQRAFSAYYYFQKMLRETRTLKEAFMYEPKEMIDYCEYNNDFTYIEHGLYYKQITHCLQLFPKEQLLVLDYEDLKQKKEALLFKVFQFLEIDTSFQPNFQSKNITGSVKNKSLQKVLVAHNNKLRKWLVHNLVDFWMPVTTRRKLKQKLFELNTNKTKNATLKNNDTAEIETIKNYLQSFFKEDTLLLDNLLQTHFYQKWFPEN